MWKRLLLINEVSAVLRRLSLHTFSGSNACTQGLSQLGQRGRSARGAERGPPPWFCFFRSLVPPFFLFLVFGVAVPLRHIERLIGWRGVESLSLYQ